MKTSRHNPLLTNRQANTPFDLLKSLKSLYFNYKIKSILKTKLRNEKVF
jgi:hypothetical protein